MDFERIYGTSLRYLCTLHKLEHNWSKSSSTHIFIPIHLPIPCQIDTHLHHFECIKRCVHVHVVFVAVTAWQIIVAIFHTHIVLGFISRSILYYYSRIRWYNIYINHGVMYIDLPAGSRVELLNYLRLHVKWDRISGIFNSIFSWTGYLTIDEVHRQVPNAYTEVYSCNYNKLQNALKLHLKKKTKSNIFRIIHLLSLSNV